MQDHQTGRGRARQLPDRLRAVGQGWHPLLLHTQLLARDTDYRVEDLKDKFGAVRVYIEMRLAGGAAARHGGRLYRMEPALNLADARPELLRRPAPPPRRARARRDDFVGVRRAARLS
ncbi:hypothetical protein ACWDCB_19430 [Streptomyces sp. NPDC001178]